MYRLSFVSAFAVLLWVLGFIVYLPVWQAGMEDSMKYGYFDDGNREYVITEPKTPLPWINYLGCEDFFSLISNTCGGYSFYKDARLLRLTRYRYNNVPYDTGGHYYYINDGGTGIRGGSLLKRSWTSIPAGMAWDIVFLPERKMG